MFLAPFIPIVLEVFRCNCDCEEQRRSKFRVAHLASRHASRRKEEVWTPLWPFLCAHQWSLYFYFGFQVLPYSNTLVGHLRGYNSYQFLRLIFKDENKGSVLVMKLNPFWEVSSSRVSIVLFFRLHYAWKDMWSSLWRLIYLSNQMIKRSAWSSMCYVVYRRIYSIILWLS